MNLQMVVATAALCCGFNLNAIAADQLDTGTTVKPTGSTVPATSAAKSPRSKKTSHGATLNTTTNADGTQSNDRLVLDSTVVTGNRELPKVMYIVPWKKADLGNLPGQPFNTLLDETLMPVDRDVFRREVQYYQVISDKDRTAAEQSTPKPDSK